MSIGSVETVRDFVDCIKETKIDGARELFDDYVNNLGAVWGRFLKYGATPTSIRNLMNGISRHISISPPHKVKPIWRVAIGPFLAEIESKARECGKWFEANTLSDDI